MSRMDSNWVSPQATEAQAKELARRSDAGQLGTICPPREVRESILRYQGDGRFHWLKRLMHSLRYGHE